MRCCTSWHAEAVETAFVIRPLRIAEIDGAAGESDGLERRPDGIGEIRASFHHNNEATAPSDVETEPICPHAETRAAGLDLGIPADHR